MTVSKPETVEVTAMALRDVVLDLPFANTAPIEWDDADWHSVRRALARLNATPSRQDGLREAFALLEKYSYWIPSEEWRPIAEKIDAVLSDTPPPDNEETRLTALVGYVQHLPACRLNMRMGAACECGLKEALSAFNNGGK